MSKQHLRSLTEEQVVQFKLNGFLTVENVLTPGFYQHFPVPISALGIPR